MTPPSFPSGSPAVALPPPGNDPQANPDTGTDGAKPTPFFGSHLLGEIIQTTGRVPTHPLTAQPPKPDAPKKEVSPQAVKKAESFDKKAQEYLDKKNYKKALAYYKMALDQNPNDGAAQLGRAKMEHATGDLLAAHDHYTDLLAADPSSQEVKALRSNVDQIILQNFQQMAPRVPKEKQAEFMKMAQTLLLESTMDRASLLAHNADQELEGLKSKEKMLAEFHGKSKQEKEAACQTLLGIAMDTLDIAQLPPLDPKDATLIPEKLGAISKEVLGVLARFAAADEDPALKRLAPLFAAYQALLDGNNKDAETAFRTVREDGMKLLGNGDAEKGEKLLKEKIEKANKAIQENDPATAEKIFQEELPPGLADAYLFLQQIDAARTQSLSLFAVDAWEEQIYSRYDGLKKDAKGFWSKPGLVWDGVWGNKNNIDKLDEKMRGEINVVSAVRGRLSTGRCANIEEALKDVVATESGDLKDGAAAALGMAKAGIDPGTFPLSKLMGLVNDSRNMNDTTANSLLSVGGTLGTFKALPKLRTFLYSTVRTYSTDSKIQADAEAGLKKVADE